MHYVPCFDCSAVCGHMLMLASCTGSAHFAFLYILSILTPVGSLLYVSMCC